MVPRRHPLLGLEGRLNRLAFLGWMLLVILMRHLALSLLMQALDPDRGSLPRALTYGVAAGCGAMLLACLGAAVALIVKRLHDRDLSGWHAAWVLAVVLLGGPLGIGLGPQFGEAGATVALGLLVWLAIARGTEGPNRFGLPRR